VTIPILRLPHPPPVFFDNAIAPSLVEAGVPNDNEAICVVIPIAKFPPLIKIIKT
jgi:hypothetical protein